ncbi:MAG: hypothetical protein LBL87_07355 [Ruminococcus sp.]|jgi:hypothetical protein|nr:hypothetical protein [Ruminococcus sp.]
MNPIPTAFLPHTCTLYTVFTNGSSSQKNLSSVRIETEKKADNYRTASGVLWYDCTNSLPKNAVFALAGETIGANIVRRQYITSADGEFDITGVKKYYDKTAAHHFEIALGGVIPYNG